MSSLFDLDDDVNPPPQIDWREALFNAGDVGPIEQIQAPAAMITSLRGILFDLDPAFYHQSSILPVLPSDPHEIYSAVAQHWLSRHPALAKAEVRNSGRGLHALLWFDEPVIFDTDGDRDRWSGIVQVVQAALPIDPDMPGITATTRPIGSINSKNGAAVELLAAGEAVTVEEVLSLYNEMIHSPFRTVMKILAGSDRVAPCPVCKKSDTRLSALDYVGKCYGSCGKVSLEDLYAQVLLPRDSVNTEVPGDVDRTE